MGFIQRELARIAKLLPTLTGTPEYDQLYAAQQALSWALEPNGFKSPIDLVAGIQEGREGYWDAPHPTPFLDTRVPFGS